MANEAFLKIQSMSDLHIHTESEHIFICRNNGENKRKARKHHLEQHIFTQ